jgi:AraC-like DNA-binding protein
LRAPLEQDDGVIDPGAQGMPTTSDAAIHTRSFTDPNRFQAAIRGGDSLYSLLGRGTFRADLTDIAIGRMKLQRGRETLPRLAASGLPANRVGIVLWPGSGRLPVVRGIQIEPGEMIFLAPGVHSYHRTFGPNEFAALTMDATDLGESAHDFTGRPLVVTSAKVLRPPVRLLTRLHSIIRSALRVSATTPAVLASPHAARWLEQALLQPVLECLGQDDERPDHTPGWRRAVLAKKFQDAVEANLDRPLLTHELSRMIGVPERSLRKICQEQMGISPMRFLALRRLHLARQALLQADHRTTTVTSIALGLGVWELGRFAVAYKSLFGESPSATLRRETVEQGKDGPACVQVRAGSA